MDYHRANDGEKGQKLLRLQKQRVIMKMVRARDGEKFLKYGAFHFSVVGCNKVLPFTVQSLNHDKEDAKSH